MERKGKIRESIRAKLKGSPRLLANKDEILLWASGLSAKQFTEYVTLRDIPSVQRMGRLNTKLMQKFVSSGRMHSDANLDVPLLTATELCTLRGF